MPEPFDTQAAEPEIFARMRALPAYSQLSDAALRQLAAACLSADALYMRRARVDEGELYDDEEAYAYICGEIDKLFPQHKSISAAFVDDYMEEYERLLESADAIEWD